MITLNTSFSLTWHPAIRSCLPEGKSGLIASLVESEVNAAGAAGRVVESKSEKAPIALNGFGKKRAELAIAGRRIDVSDKLRSSTLAIVRLNDSLHKLQADFPGLKVESIELPKWVSTWAAEMITAHASVKAKEEEKKKAETAKA